MESHVSGRLRRACALMCALLAPALTPAEQLVVTPIAVAGQTAPAEGRYILFGDIDVDSVRRVTYTASMSSGRNVIFRTHRGAPVPMVLTGDDAPPDAGTAFDTLLEASSNAAGDLVFIASLFFPQRTGVFLLRGGVITTLALEGAAAPTRRGERFAAFDQLRLLDTGAVYFSATLRGPPADPQPMGRAIVRAVDGVLEPVIVPGDTYMGLRQVEETLQYDVSASEEVVALARITDRDFLQGTLLVSEIILLSGGQLRTLASVDLSISGGVDLVRNFAVTFDQVHIDVNGLPSFYAGTNDHPLGGVFRNTTGRLFGNARVVVQGDPSPVAPGDVLGALGAFGLNGADTLVLHALTRDHRTGGLFARQAGGDLETVALAGEPRPGGQDVWHGFLQIDLNEEGAFVFTDFQNLLVQVGVFLGRFLPPPGVILERLIDLVDAGDLDRGLNANLTFRLQSIGRSLARDDQMSALRQTEALLTEVDRRAGRILDEATAERLSALLEDLVASLGGLPAPGRSGGNRGARSRAPRR